MNKLPLNGLLFFLCLTSGSAAGQALPDSVAPTRWYSSRAGGVGLPLGGFNRTSDAGFSSAFDVSYRLGEPAGRWWVGALGFFGDYGFTSSFVQDGNRFELEGERSVIGAFGLVGREVPLDEHWSLHLYAGVGGARIGSSQLDVSATQVTVRSSGALFYGLLTGSRLEYAFRPRIRLFLSVMGMAYPTARFEGSRFIHVIPQLGYSVPLGRRVESRTP